MLYFLTALQAYASASAHDGGLARQQKLQERVEWLNRLYKPIDNQRNKGGHLISWFDIKTLDRFGFHYQTSCIFSEKEKMGGGGNMFTWYVGLPLCQ